MTTSHDPASDCVIVGGGPCGMFLALLLARQNVQVTLLEAHQDFDRDFRGDTVHPSTLELLDALGLMSEVQALPHGTLEKFTVHTPEGSLTTVDFSRLPTRYPYIMMLPQAQLLDLLAREAKKYPHLRILMGAKVVDLLRDGPTIRGVVYRQDGGADTPLRAGLTVAADGRFSQVRKLAGLEPVRTSPPMDVVWLRLDRQPDDPTDQGLISDGERLCVLFARAREWQLGLVIPKGGFKELREAGLEAFRAQLASVVPWLRDRVGQIQDWHQLTLLSVESNRLKKWHLPGLLLIGDAAHAMSPVGGVGINYAVQDAVAAANYLAKPLRRGKVVERDLVRVQERREWPVRLIQFLQGMAQREMIAPAVGASHTFRMPVLARMLTKIPLVRSIPARVIGLGLRREHIRPPLSVN